MTSRLSSLIEAAEGGDLPATEALFSALYSEQRRMRQQRLSEIGEALERLAKVDPELAALVDMKFFGGFSSAEIGAMHNQSERTVQRNWQKTRIFLHQELSADLSV